jgi:mannose-1-phosphate guanylyltransferase/phosphomannomutase
LKAVVLAGGLGTRLRPLTCNLPKPMAPVMNRPILEHIVHHLKKHGFTDLVFLLYHQPETIQNYFDDGSRFGVSITHISASEDYGTAGAVKLAANVLSESFLVVSGDGLTNLNLTRFVDFHKEKHGLGALALAHVPDPSPFGLVITDQQQRITRFLEKPSWGQVFSDTVNMGVYLLEPQLLDFIPEGREFYFEKDVYPKLLEQGCDLFGFVDACYWRDIGDLRSYHQAHRDVLEGKIQLEIAEPRKNGVWRGKGSKLGKGVKLEGSLVIGENCQVGDGVTLRNVVLGDHCTVGRNSIITDSILWSGARIGDNCELVNDVIGRGVVIENGCVLDQNVFIGDGSKIGAQSHITPNVKIWPNKDIDVGSVVNASMVWGDRWQRELFIDARVTGLANFEISPEFGAKLGAAFGAWVGKGQQVVVSRDATPAARMIDRAIITGLMSAGVQIQNLEVMPIPIARYGLRAAKSKAGLHVRRSPFEKNLLDILFFDSNGRDISNAIAKTIERNFYREDFPRVAFDEVGDIDYPVRVTQSYAQDFLQHVDIAAIGSARFKVVIDYSCGAATQVFPSILGSLDCDVISLNAFLDPERLSRSAEEFQQALVQLSKIVKSTGANVGFLIDAGAEKIFCVDEKGDIIPSNRLAVLIAMLYIEQNHPRKLAVPVSVPSQVAALAHDRGVELLCTANDGGSLIKATEDAGVRLALDITGGLIFPEFHSAFDGMFSIVKILEMLAKSKSTLRKIQSRLPKRVLAVAQAPCPWEAKGTVMRRLDEDSQGQNRLLADGIRINFDDAWVLILPDRDKAGYHILAEAGNNGVAEKLVAQYKQKVVEWSNG